MSVSFSGLIRYARFIHSTREVACCGQRRHLCEGRWERHLPRDCLSITIMDTLVARLQDTLSSDQATRDAAEQYLAHETLSLIHI